MVVHDDYKEMIPAHVLSALDAADERALNEHLAECAECRRDLAEWEATAASLALVSAPTEPSPQVREDILRSVSLESSTSSSEKPLSNVLPLPGPRRNVWNSLGSLGAIAAVILFAALIITIIILWQQNRRLKQENQVVQLVSSPGTTQVKELKGTAEAPGASAKILIDWQGNALLVVNGLPAPPNGKEYQLWFVEPHHPPKPGKTFSTDTAGKGMVDERVGASEREYAVFAVTLEPAGGVQSPTGEIYLRSEP